MSAAQGHGFTSQQVRPTRWHVLRAAVVAAGRWVIFVLLLALALLAGLVTAAAAAVAGAHPTVAMVAGAVAAALCAAGVTRLTTRRATRAWRSACAVLAGVVVAVFAVSLVVPPSGRPAAPDPGSMAFWDLPTGSRLANVRLPGVGSPRPAPVVVLHGGPGIPDTARSVQLYAPLTRLGFDVVVYEQLGAGRSSRPDDSRDYGVDRDVTDLEAIRQQLEVPRLTLVGWSYGGALAASYLAAHPEHVAAMVLISPGALDPGDRSADRATSHLGIGERAQVLAELLAPRALLGYALLQVDPLAAHEVFGDGEADARNDAVLTASAPGLHCPGHRPDPVHGSGFYALQYPQSATAPDRPDVRPTLRGLRVPTLVLKGSCDYLSWRSATTYLELLPESSLVYLPDAGHDVLGDQPDEALACISAFLDGGPTPLPATRSTVVPASYKGPA